MNIRAEQRIKYSQSAWVTDMLTLLVFDSILFYSICNNHKGGRSNEDEEEGDNSA